MATLTKEKISGRYGDFDAYVVSGNTRPIKDQLKALGFKWYNAKSVWWISAKKFNTSIKQQLQSMGITEGNAPNESPQSPQSPQSPTQGAPHPTPSAPTQQWVTEDEKMTAWYGFPMNKDIHVYEVDIPFRDKVYKASIHIDRTFQPGKGSDRYNTTKSRAHRGLPKYVFRVEIPELDMAYSMKTLSKEKWGTYNEEEKIQEIKELMQTHLENENSKVIKQVQLRDDLSRRSDEYKKFLNDIGDGKIKSDFNIAINDPQYGGNYKMRIKSLGTNEKSFDVSFEPVIDNPLAPKYATVGNYRGVDIYETYSIGDFNSRVEQHIRDNHEELEKGYIKYLQSFPYLQEQQGEAQGQFETISRIISDGIGDIDFVFRKLTEKGYIRPSKRQKQQGEGVSIGTEIKWVLETKQILDDAYGPGYLGKTPEYFYSVVAYYIHRRMKNITSWTEMALVDAMRTWINTMNGMGAELDFKQVHEIISSIGNAIIEKLTGRSASKSRWEQYNEWQNGNVSPGTGVGNNTAVQELVNFAQQFNIPTDNIETNAKKIYRTLANHVHPDKYRTESEEIQKEKEEQFKILTNIWERIPEQIKTATCHWYHRYKTLQGSI